MYKIGLRAAFGIELRSVIVRAFAIRTTPAWANATIYASANLQIGAALSAGGWLGCLQPDLYR